MLLCKQSTWSSQTKEHVCCTPSPYHASAGSARRGPGLPARCHLSPQFKHPERLAQEVVGEDGGAVRYGRGGGDGEPGLHLRWFHHRPGNSTDPSQPSPKLLRFHFTPDRLPGESPCKDHSPGTPSVGGGPGPCTAVKTSPTGGCAHLHSLAQAAGRAGSARYPSARCRAVIALGLVISCALLISPEDGSHPGEGGTGRARGRAPNRS
jgi:hypothetical protein